MKGTGKMKTSTGPSLLVSLSLFLVFAAGCASKQNTGPGARNKILFIDSRNFDSKLSRALKDDHSEVTVTFLGDVSINEIPKRMEEWLAKAEHYEGTVAVEPDPKLAKTKSASVVIAGITVAVATYKYLRRKSLFRPVEDYDVLIHHIPGEAVISRIVFKRKDR